MKKLNEQWIEEDGCMYKKEETNVNPFYKIIKLGPVNKDGCLPCPICGKYPNEVTPALVACSDNGHSCEVYGYGNTQANIDAWNKRK